MPTMWLLSMNKNLKIIVGSIVILIFILPPKSTQSQDIFENIIYSQEDGLPSGTLRKITKDSTGFLWITSENGLSRFDGYSFISFKSSNSQPSGLSSSDIINIAVDINGKFYVQTANSISIYNPENKSFKRVFGFKRPSEIRHFGVGTFGCWFKTKDSIKIIDSNTETLSSFAINTNAPILSYLNPEDLDASVWFVHEKKIVAFIPNKRAFFFGAYKQNNPSVANNFFPTRIFKTHKTISFYNDSGLFSFDFKIQQFKRVAIQTPILNSNNLTQSPIQSGRYISLSAPYNKIFVIDIITGRLFDFEIDKLLNSSTDITIKGIFNGKNETFWISLQEGILIKIHPLIGIVDRLVLNDKYNNTPHEKNVEDVFEDDNVLWVALTGVGLVKGKKITPLFNHFIPPYKVTPKPFDLYRNVRTISQINRENILVGTLAGLFNFNLKSKKFTDYQPNQSTNFPLNNAPISKIISTDDSVIYISKWRGSEIFRISKKNNSITYFKPDKGQGEGQYNIRTIFLDSKGFLWVGTDANLIYKINVRSKNYETERFYGSYSNPDSLLFNITFTLFENKNGEILIGTQNGLYIYSYSNGQLKKFFSDKQVNYDLSNDNIRSLYIDKKDVLWIGTSNRGLYAYDFKKTNLTAFTTDNGLSDNSVYSITDDNYNNLWLGTNKGLCCFNTLTNECRNYTLRDGIQNNEFNTDAAFKLADGTIVMGGINGINVFNPKLMKHEKQVPKVIITQFKAGEDELPITNNVLNLKANQNYLSFQFAALNFFRIDENKYAYRLIGLDKNWIYTADRRFTNYSNLLPGKYVFQVKALNFAGKWSEVQQLIFTIATPWYETWIFRLALALTIAAIIYLIFRQMLNQKLKLQEVRNRIASDLHDEIGSTLSSVHIYSEVALKTVNDKAPEASTYLNKISVDVTNMIDALSDIVWTVNSKNDRFENIINKMRVTAIELFEARNIEVDIDIDDNLNSLKMGMVDRKNFYLFFKEVINNIAKYSKATSVSIILKFEFSKIKLTVKDNGVGFKQDENLIGNGLNNMKKRANDLKGEFKIHSDLNSGTKIELTFPFS